MARTGKPTHRPHEHGAQVFRRGRWWAADLRPWEPQRAGIALRPTLRDPKHPGWPKRGDKTEDEAEARRWAWKYVDHLNDAHQRRRAGKGRKVASLDRAIEEYTRHRERTQEPNTVQADGTALNHMKAHLGGRRAADNITADDLQPWFDDRLDEDYKASTLERYRLSLSAFFDWLGGYNPAADVVLPKQEERDARPFTDAELRRIRAAADKISPEHRRYVELGIATGGRYSELLALRYEDFDRAQRSVRFRRQATNEGRAVTKGLKGDRNRTALVLPSWWDWHDRDEGWVVKVKRPMVKVLEGAGIDEPEVLNHSLRHTYARICRERLHVPISILKVYMGHKSERTTEDAYGWMGKDVALDFGVRAAYGDG